MARILILGHGVFGRLAAAEARARGHDTVVAYRSSRENAVDVTNPDMIRRILARENPDGVLHTHSDADPNGKRDADRDGAASSTHCDLHANVAERHTNGHYISKRATHANADTNGDRDAHGHRHSGSCDTDTHPIAGRDRNGLLAPPRVHRRREKSPGVLYLPGRAWWWGSSVRGESSGQPRRGAVFEPNRLTSRGFG